MSTHHTRRGSSILPYGLLVGLVAVVATASVRHTGETSSALLAGISERLTSVNAAIQGSAGDESAEEDGPLYPFDGHTFTTCGATGRFGPEVSACRSAYQTASGWSDMSPFFGMDTQGIQTLVVPHDGRYRIEAKGARGGDGYSSHRGGFGARIVATLDLKRGQLLKVAVGQAGGNRGNAGGGGGGGSFVALDTPNSTPAFADTPLVAAGGGGGGAHTSKGGHGYDILADISTCGTGTKTSHKGAGFCGDGNSQSRAFLNGGQGGHKGSQAGGDGGFGGGGAGSNDSQGADEDRGGGGGGYRGGNNKKKGRGYGGLSFVTPGSDFAAATETAAAGANTSDGSVTITPLTP